MYLMLIALLVRLLEHIGQVKRGSRAKTPFVLFPDTFLYYTINHVFLLSSNHSYSKQQTLSLQNDLLHATLNLFHKQKVWNRVKHL